MFGSRDRAGGGSKTGARGNGPCDDRSGGGIEPGCRGEKQIRAKARFCVHYFTLFTINEHYVIVNDMKTERDTLEACADNLRALEAIKDVDLRERDGSLPSGVDAKLLLRTNAGRLVYFVEVKRTVNAAGLEHLIHQLERYAQGTKAKPILLSNYLSPNIAARLIGAGVNFADAAGNVYINWPGKLHIQILGVRPKQLAESKSERLSQPSGLKVLYTLLTQPSGELGAYRDIAKASGVALGSIAWVIRELKAKDYLTQTGPGQWKLRQKRKLLDLWVAGYSARLRPNLLMERYQPPETELRQTMQLLQDKLEAKKISWALTGGFAADILTRHFRGEQLSFFVQEWPTELTRQLKWLPSEQGRVTVLRKFSPRVAFNLGSPRSQPVAHPLLVYAELIFQGRERELETAKILYDRHLTSIVNEDGA